MASKLETRRAQCGWPVAPGLPSRHTAAQCKHSHLVRMVYNVHAHTQRMMCDLCTFALMYLSELQLECSPDRHHRTEAHSAVQAINAFCCTSAQCLNRCWGEQSERKHPSPSRRHMVTLAVRGIDKAARLATHVPCLHQTMNAHFMNIQP